MTNRKVTAQGIEIAVVSVNENDYISLTDMVKISEDGEQLIKNWLQNKNTIEFLGIWEKINNPSFNLVNFQNITLEAGLNRFVMSTKKWIEITNAIGLIASAGRYGGTYAHKDIAIEFAGWLSPSFKLKVIQTVIKGGNIDEALKNFHKFCKFDKNTFDKPSFVYLMRDNATNLIKIGKSNNPAFREKTLQSQKPCIEIVTTKKLSTISQAILFEKSLHLKFAKNRIRGEWFNLSDKDLQDLILAFGKQ